MAQDPDRPLDDGKITLPKIDPGISHDFLLRVLKYDPDTGVFTWKVRLTNSIKRGTVAGTTRPDGRRQICIDRTFYLSSRLAWFYVHGTWPYPDIDHINRIRDDDRITNLREATRRENTINGDKETRGINRVVSSRFKGVSRHHTGKWEARIDHSIIGIFFLEEDAATAYNKEAIKRFGKFAVLNNIIESPLASVEF